MGKNIKRDTGLIRNNFEYARTLAAVKDGYSGCHRNIDINETCDMDEGRWFNELCCRMFPAILHGVEGCCPCEAYTYDEIRDIVFQALADWEEFIKGPPEERLKKYGGKKQYGQEESAKSEQNHQ